MNSPSHPEHSHPNLPDDILVQQSLTGNSEAFEHLVERYQPLLVRSISCWCMDHHLVADIVQRVLIQLYRSLPTLHPNRSLKTWLLRVAHNCWVDEQRRAQPLFFSQFEAVTDEESLSLLAILPDPDPLPEELAEQREGYAQIVQTISSLPGKKRAIVWMRCADHLSYAEIGRRLNISAATAKTTFVRAKSFLRQSLAQEASSDPAL